MRRSVSLVTGPAAEPLILNEVKEWLKIDGTDEDALLAALITAACQAAEQFLRRAIISQTLKLTVDLAQNGLMDRLGEGVYDLPVTAIYGGLPRVVQLPRPPILSVASVVTYDTSGASSTFDPTNYYVDTAGSRLVLYDSASWPTNLRPVAACEITYVAGYGTTSSAVPQPIKSAMLMHIQRMYDGRIVCDMPEGCQQLLRPYRVMDGLAHA